MAFSLDMLKQKVFQFDGIQVTVGALIVVVVIAFLVFRARRG
jgi:hypothetical protein